MMDLQWLNSIIDLLPSDEDYQNSFFDIAGFPKWETVNSNMLAFYFDKGKEHDLNTLFIESILKLLKKDEDINFDDNFEVFKEYRTINGNYIDLVIKSNLEESSVLNSSDEVETESEKTDWAIVIENKIEAPLYNSLEDYWSSVDATHKIGIVLSKNKIDLSMYNVRGVYFHSITHESLVEEVLHNLPKYFSNANEKHLILLKEYINNIQNIYHENIMDQQYSKILNQFYEHRKKIKELHKTETSLLKYVSEEVFEIFYEFGFKPYSDKKTSNAKHFFADKEKIDINFDGLRFWVSIEHLVFNKEFKACFELHNKSNTKYGSEVKEILSSKNIFTEYVLKGTGGGDNKGYNHIYLILIPLTITENSDFSYELRTQLETHFFRHKNNFLFEAVDVLNQVEIK